jgi:hypothetical protein
MSNVIQLGDWIDLEGGITVTAYGLGDNTGAINAATNTPITTNSPPFGGYDGMSLRLIVVGINSFQNGGSDGSSEYRYQGDDEPPAHVVFQFQNIPGERRMNPTGTNSGGYKLSEIREYLIPVNGKGGNFLEGLYCTTPGYRMKGYCGRLRGLSQKDMLIPRQVPIR